ncbi:MAG TPA: hypothetical protein VMU29_07500 [Smithella sp.]|nr:hypothetical protein [Smithella sp.]
MIIILFITGILFSIISLKYLPYPFIWIYLCWTISFLYLTFNTKKMAQKSIWFNLAFIAFFLGVLEVYSFYSLNNPENNPRFEGEYTQDYSAPDDILGYAPHKNKTVSSREYLGKRLLYNVTYTINDLGLRDSTSSKPLHQDQCVLFFGDSFTFGEGVNDFETLPYTVQKLSKYPVYNFGFHGYGAHQMLSAIEHGMVKDIINCEPRIVIYQAALFQVTRSAGYSWWNKHGPRYILLPDGSIKYYGHFDDGNWFQNKARAQLAKSFTYKKYLIYKLGRINKKDLKLFIEIIGQSQKLLKEQYPKMEFHVIYWDDKTDRFNNFFIDALKNKGIPVHLVSQILPDYPGNPSRYLLSQYDKHPNVIAYQDIAQYVVDKIVQK